MYMIKSSADINTLAASVDTTVATSYPRSRGYPLRTGTRLPLRYQPASPDTRPDTHRSSNIGDYCIPHLRNLGVYAVRCRSRAETGKGRRRDDERRFRHGGPYESWGIHSGAPGHTVVSLQVLVDGRSIDAELTILKIDRVRVCGVGRFGDWAIRLGHQQTENLRRGKQQHGRKRWWARWRWRGAVVWMTTGMTRTMIVKLSTRPNHR